MTGFRHTRSKSSCSEGQASSELVSGEDVAAQLPLHASSCWPKPMARTHCCSPKTSCSYRLYGH